MLPVEIENKKEEIKARLDTFGVWLVDIAFRKSSGRGVLTIIVDKKGGITLDDCVVINHSMSQYFDELACAVLDSGYYLEVNSPGLDRPMRTAEDFSRAIGETVKLVVKEGPTRTIEIMAEIFAVQENGITIRKIKAADLIELPLNSIVRAVREIKF